MNQNCPSCGALYNVADKDIGRRLKCKKCNTALKVTDKGLEEDRGTESSPPVSDPKPDRDERDRDRDRDDRDDEPRKKKRDRDRDRDRPERTGPGLIELVGGIPTILFGIGVFFVILFTSLPIIGAAGTDRASAYVDKLENEKKVKLDALVPKGKKPTEITPVEAAKILEDGKKIEEDYARRISDARLDAESTKIGNRRDVWMEQYGLMFGFLFLSFGCIGYLRTDQPLILKIVAAVVLGVMLIVIFGKFGGCTGLR